MQAPDRSTRDPSARASGPEPERRRLSAAVVEGRLSPGAFLAEHTAAADRFLGELFSRAVAAGATRPGSGYALVAVGGYGRGELCPGSDLDVLLLHDRRSEVAELANAVWYGIWDAGVRLDHSVRTPKEAATLAGTDVRVAAGFLDSRLVAGDEALLETTRARVLERWRARHRDLLGDLRASVRQRHELFGTLAYLLEPDLKDSAGGLRDLETMALLASALPVLAELIGPEPFGKERQLLLWSRVCLQARTGTRSNRLLLQEQDDVAKLLGFEDADEYAAALASAGHEVNWALSDAWRRVESMLAGPARRSGGRDAPAGRGVVLRDGEVALAPGVEPGEDPALVLRVASAAAISGAPIATGTLRRLEVDRPSVPLPWPDELREAFVSLLEYGPAATPVIESLDRFGLFEWFVPEWSSVRHRPQRNAYHRYTVDRHLLEAVARCAPLLRRVERPDLLLVAALLHDVAKGRPGDHSEVGRAMAGAAARRMGFAGRDVAVLERLVKRHLLLADTATRRDLDDDETIELVAEAVGDELTLDLLEALTEADSLATGPAAWGAWKASLVHALAGNVRSLLRGQPVAPRVTRPLEPEVRALVGAGRTAVRVDGDAVTVVAPDRTGLFALAAGTLAVHGLDIRRATARRGDELETAGPLEAGGKTETGVKMVVEHFEVGLDPGRSPDAGRLEADLTRALSGELPIEALLASADASASRYRRPAAATSPSVVVLADESASEHAALVEVRAPDSPGLCYRLCSVLSAEGLDVVSAHVATIGHEAVDAFYLREQLDGRRPSADRLAGLRAALERAATAPHDREKFRG